MLKKFTKKLKTSLGVDASAQISRHGRFQRQEPVMGGDMGKWIWTTGSDEPCNSYVYFRKLIELKAKPTRAILSAASDTRYKLYINGEYVGKGPVRSCSGYTYYDSFDITERLTRGKNVIAIHAIHIGEKTNFAPLKKPGLVCRAEIESNDEIALVVSDETWSVHAADDWTNLGGRISDALGFQEVYNGALRIEGWNQAKFGERSWENAVVVGTVPSMPWGTLVEREIAPLAEEKVYPNAIFGLFNSPERSIDTPPSDMPLIMADSELAPLKSGKVVNSEALLSDSGETKISTPRSDMGVVVVLDFGREVFGNVELGVAGSASACIDIGYSEILEDGRVKPDRGGMRYTDRVMLKKGRLEWQGFEPRALRYMQIEFRRCSGTVALEYVRINQTTYPVKNIGSFECSDQLLNDIWRIGAYTTRLCMEDTFIDCPWRERAMWWGDARIQSRSAFYAFDDTRLLAQGLRQLASQQTDEGAILGMYPGESDKLMPDFSISWLFSLLDYYAFADDAGLLRELYPNVERLLEWFGKHISPDGLLEDVPGWLFIDWADLDKRGEVTALNCLYYHALRVAAVLAAITDREEDSDGFLEASVKLRLAINKFLYSPRQGLYADCRVDGLIVDTYSPQTNILAALFDVADQYRKASILRTLIGSSLAELNTPYIVSHLVETLCADDHHVDALHVIRKKWGELVRAGAATFPEFFDGDGSKCHGWSVGPVRDLIAEFVGIKPVLGSHRFSVRPQTGDLKWARGSVNTKVGLLRVDWKIIRGALSIGVEVPQGVKVDVYPPCPDDCRITVDGKSHEARFVTLSGGSHVVRVDVVKPAKPARVDKSLEPPPMPHVEILGEALVRRRGRLGLTTERRTRGRRGKEDLIETDTVELETTELSEWMPVETQPEIVSEEAVTPKRKRSRRGGKGHSQGTEVVEPVKSVEVAAPVAEAQVEKAAEPKDSSRRRRSHRGGRGRSRGAEIAEAAEVTQPVAVPEPAVEFKLVDEALIDEGEIRKPRGRRGRRGGRGRSRGAETVESTEAIEVQEPPVESELVKEAIIAEEETRRPRGRRGRRGGRGRSHGAEIAEVAEITEPIAIPEPPVESELVKEAIIAEEETRRPRSRRGRRGGRGRSRGAETIEAIESLPIVAPEPIQAESTPEPSSEPRRRTHRGGRGRNKKHPAEIPPQPAAEQPRQPRRPNRKPAAKAAEETPKPAIEPAQEPPAAKPNRRRSYNRKPKAE
ncbi:MAG: family 78 glycoside hydrolase catalytic domain [Armatimonadetes bacterium]|nr:family 78 glycoside hydrolase catalytic domain [Armatimonadota bacterium]